MEKEKGIVLAYLTALISGISVFVNSIGVLSIDPIAYTFIRNFLVALVLVSFGIFIGNWKEINKLQKKELLLLFAVGIIGGGIAFALFFTGLSQIAGAYGSFIYRLLFLFAAVIGFFAFKEKITATTLGGVLIVLIGNIILLGPEKITVSLGALMVLAATVLWAIEYSISKKLLEGLSPLTVGSFRMGIGGIVLLGLLLYQGKFDLIFNISPSSISWILISTALLSIFITLWYSALKHTTLTASSAALTLGGPISAVLSFIFAAKTFTLMQATGLLLLAVGTIFIIGITETFQTLYWVKRKILTQFYKT